MFSSWRQRSGIRGRRFASGIHSGAARTAALASCVAIGSLGIVVLPGGGAEAAPSVWLVASSPNPSTYGDTLNGVSCSSTSYCVAVGDEVTSSGDTQTLVESWDGSDWTVIHSPNPSSSGDSLSSVFCSNATFCMAVGVEGPTSEPTQTLIESWNGSAWSVDPSPNEGYEDELSSVTCTSVTSCIAVGSYSSENSENSQTLIEFWNGTAWTISSSPNHLNKPNSLFGVSCASSVFCVAVGFVNLGPTKGAQGLVEIFNGSEWTVTASASKSAGYYLSGVSCTTPSFCDAAGYHYVVAEETLVEKFNGTVWSTSTSSNKGNNDSGLYGIACLSSKDCVAVGAYEKKSEASSTLVEVLGKSGWSITPSPDGGSSGSGLFGISCISPSFCVAVGSYRSGEANQTLVETGS
jgi:hypothetical protein